jgi:hypothetical protein
MRLLLIFTLCASYTYAACSSSGTTLTAASCGSTDVAACFSAATASTTLITIPPGTCTWTTGDSFTVPTSMSLTIQGSTTITGNCSPQSSTCTAADNTVIIDNYASTNPLLSITTQSGCTLLRVTGLTFEGGTGSVKQTGMLQVGGSCHNFRLDHNHFYLSPSSLANIGVRFLNWVYGVMDHNLCDMTTSQTSECVNVWMDAYNGTTDGHGAWIDPTNLGTSKFMVIENNVINNGLYADDCDVSGREVFRFNVVNNAETQTHPTGSSPNAFHGCRAKETYENQFNGLSTCNGSSGFNNCLYNMMFLSSGTGVIWGNTAPIINAGAESGYQWVFSIQSMRTTNSTYPQNTPPAGWGYCGTAQTGTASNWDQNTNSTGYACLDQPGRGQYTDSLSGEFEGQGGTSPYLINTATGTVAWPVQALEPYYEWLDSLTPVPDNPGGTFTNSTSSVLTQNVDFYTYTSSFTGAAGVGSGTMAARPSTCTTGVAYWDTSEGTWNNGTANSGELDECTATNTWTNGAYVPYTYPHPLEGGSSAVGSAISSGIYAGSGVSLQ